MPMLKGREAVNEHMNGAPKSAQWQLIDRISCTAGLATATEVSSVAGRATEVSYTVGLATATEVSSVAGRATEVSSRVRSVRGQV